MTHHSLPPPQVHQLAVAVFVVFAIGGLIALYAEELLRILVRIHPDDSDGRDEGEVVPIHRPTPGARRRA